MYFQGNPNEAPGVGTTVIASNRSVWKNRQGVQYLPGGAYIDGVNSRDPSNVVVGSALPNANANYYGTLQAGVVMGKVTSNGYYAPSIIGLTTLAYNTASGNTNLQVSPAVAVEIVRRIGSTGTLNLIGPPTANSGNSSQVATQAVTFSAVNTISGNCTVTPVAANAVIGSIVAANDGSQTPKTFIDQEDGIRVTDGFGNSIAQVQFPRPPVAGGVVNTANVVNYPADTSLALWLKGQLDNAGATFVFSDNY